MIPYDVLAAATGFIGLMFIYAAIEDAEMTNAGKVLSLLYALVICAAAVTIFVGSNQ